MLQYFKIITTSLVLFFFFAVKAQKKNNENNKGLKDYYAKYFPIGVAVSPQSLRSADTDLIIKQFNSVTPENAMKVEAIHPK